MTVEASPAVAEALEEETRLGAGRGRPRGDGVRNWALGVWSALALLYLFIPVFIVVLFSFNDNKGRFNFTWEGFTLRHWKHPFADPDLAHALTTSLEIAVIATLIATALGTFMAMALVRYRFRGRSTVDFFVFMPLSEAQAFFNREDDVTVVEVFLEDADRVDEARNAIEMAAERPVILTDWRQRNRSFFAALEVERNVMFIILSVVVLVAAFIIISGLIMLVQDKREDIAILRTMGATRGAVMRVFLITGMSIGGMGTLAGFLLGLVFTANIQKIQEFVSWMLNRQLWDPTLRFLSQVPAEVDPGEVAAIVAMSLVLAFLATLYPSWRASRIDPVEALRYG